MIFSHSRTALLLACVFLVPPAFAQTPAPGESRLQGVVDEAVRVTLAEFSSRALKADRLAVTLVDLRDPARPVQASARGDVPIYPASVIKLFYLAAAHRWMEDGRLADTPELRRAMRDMIVDSSNDATHYVIDLLTGTNSGPELSDAEIAAWFDKREAVSRYFSGLGYTNVIANKKPWGDGPYGRESQAIRMFEPKRNMLSTEATARLFVEIANGRCVTAARSAQMLELLARDPATKVADPDDQAKFTGPALPPGAKLWSKAGWTSKTRHDAVLVEVAGGARYVLVTYTTEHSSEPEIIRSVAKSVFASLSAR